jgi:hypothetical protein
MKKRAIFVVLVVAAALVALLLWERPPSERSGRRASTVDEDAPRSATASGAGAAGPDGEPGAGVEVGPAEPPGSNGPLRIAPNPYPPRGLSLAEQEIPSKSKTLVTGRVIDPEGEPIVTRTLAIFFNGRIADFARTDRKGRFEITFKDGPYDLILHHRNLYARARGLVAGTRDLVLKARSRKFDRTLRVRVCAPDGLPMKSAWVTSWFPIVSARTGKDGVAVLCELPDHEVRIRVHPPLSREDLVETRPVWALPEGQEISVVVYAGERIHGSVRRSDGSPASRVTVWAMERETRRYSTVTNDQGLFSLLVPLTEGGPWTLEASDVVVRERGRVSGVQTGAHDLVIQLAKVTSRR